MRAPAAAELPAAAKLLRDFIHIDLLVLGTQADACQFGFEFFKDARNNDRFNRADMVNEPLGIVALGAGAVKSAFFSHR